MPYIQQSDLEALLSAPVVLAIYDDQNLGVVNQTVLNEILQLASSRVDSYLATVYAGPFPITQFPIPMMIKDAALAWARAFSFERHSEYVRQHGKTPRKEAEDLCNRLTSAKEFLTDYLAQPQPANVGGIVLNSGPRMLVDGPGGINNGGDFAVAPLLGFAMGQSLTAASIAALAIFVLLWWWGTRGVPSCGQ